MSSLIRVLVQRKNHKTEGFILTIGQKIRNQRLALKMTQTDLAKKLGVHRDTIMHYEDDSHLPRTKDRKLRLAQILQISYNDLFRDDERLSRREIGLDWLALEELLKGKTSATNQRFQQLRLWKAILKYLDTDRDVLVPEDRAHVGEMLMLIRRLDGTAYDKRNLAGGGNLCGRR